LKSPRDFLYGLLKGRHIERWHRFERFRSLERLRVIMYIQSHSNHAKAKDIIDALVDAGDPRSPETLARLIRYMKTDNILQENNEGVLSTNNELRFVVKEIRGSLKDFWFLIGLAVSISGCVINFVEHGFGTVEVFFLVITAVIFFKIVDDILHETMW